ncbi:MAG: hypothetical protein ACREBZ_00375 [Thermoplasmata archaeon]
MAVARLPSVVRVPAFDSEGADLLEDLVARGVSIGVTLMGMMPAEEMWRARARVFRKWAFDCLFYLSSGPMGFNQLGEQLGRLGERAWPPASGLWFSVASWTVTSSRPPPSA